MLFVKIDGIDFPIHRIGQIEEHTDGRAELSWVGKDSSHNTMLTEEQYRKLSEYILNLDS